jgi:hypothetical protein
VISDRLSVSLPVVEVIGSEAKSRFTGTIHKVTIDVKEMKKADKAEEGNARTEYVHKKAMSD